MKKSTSLVVTAILVAASFSAAAGTLVKGANELQFMLYMGLNTTFNGKNATCYSRVVSVPAPSPRWKTKDQRSKDYEAAMKIIKNYHDRFVSLCGEWGKPTDFHVSYGINDRYSDNADNYYKTYRDSFPDGKGEVVLNP